MNSINFTKSYEKIMLNEGLYSNHPDDKGGETWKGIARKFHPDWKGWEIIDKTSKDKLKENIDLEKLVREFYFDNYYYNINLHRIEDLDIVIELFDIAVNQGIKTAGDFFQRSLNLLNNNQKLYNDIVIDGNIGDKTIEAYNSFMSIKNRIKEKNVKTFVKVLNGLQFTRYLKICEMNPTQEVFFYGWMNRV